jgi:hypothetical protein
VSPADRPALTKKRALHPVEPEPIEPAPAVPAHSPGAEVLLAVRVPAELRRWLKQASLDHDRTMRELVIDAIEAHRARLNS